MVCENKDPIWFNRAIKSLIQEKKDIFKSENSIQLLQHLRILQKKLILS